MLRQRLHLQVPSLSCARALPRRSAAAAHATVTPSAAAPALAVPGADAPRAAGGFWAEKRLSRVELPGRQPVDLRRQRYLQGSQEKDVSPDAPDQRAAVVKVSRLGRQRRWEEALQAFAAEAEPGVVLYSAVVDACVKAMQRPAAWRLFQEMPQKTRPAYNCLIGLEGRLKRVASAEGLLRQMQADCFEPNVTTYTGLINAHGMVRDVASALRVLEDMDAQGIKPDNIAYGAAMAACGRAGDRASAARLLARMDALGLSADISHLTSVITACAQSKDEAGAREALSDLRRRGLHPDVVTYTIVLGCLSGADALARAEAVIGEMEAEGVRPDTVTYNAVLKLAAEAGDEARFNTVVAAMEKRGLRRNQETEHCEVELKQVVQRRAAEVTLAVGWSEAADPATGRRYYWQDADPAGTTTWVRPAAGALT